MTEKQKNIRYCNIQYNVHTIHTKVEKSLKSSLDSIPSPSPSVKIQIMAGKV